MTSLSDLILILALLANLTLLGSGRLRACIQQVAAQGVVVGLLPLLVSEHGIGVRLVLVAAVSIVLRGVVFPKLLLRSLRHANVRREVNPVVGYAASMLIGLALFGLSFWLSSHFRSPRGVVSDLALPVALATILCGLFLIVSRRQAVNQVIGYLVLENGVYVFGVALAHKEPLLIEMGILLDVFAAVFVMGIAVFRIGREFDHIDVDRLAQLKD
jgi:hydrogenase-4 component E